MSRLMIFFSRLLSILAGRRLSRKEDIFFSCACSNDFSLVHAAMNKYFTSSSWVCVRFFFFFFKLLKMG